MPKTYTPLARDARAARPYRGPVATFRPGNNLNARVAEHWGRPAVERITRALAERVMANAPAGEVWITARDERVRPTHRDADAQLIPANLRFILEKPCGVGHELARAPRDPELSEGNRINCRCVSTDIAGAIAQGVSTDGPRLEGARVRGTVTVKFPRVVESENPGAADGGGGWVARSIREAADQLHSASRR
jgi:hypothetical protein